MRDTLTHRQLQSLIQVSNVLNTSLQIETIIDAIMMQTISVIEAADGGVLFLYDPKEICLIAKSVHGFNPQSMNQVRLKPGESMTGLAFSTKQCQLFSNQKDIRKAMKTLATDTYRKVEQSIPNFPYAAVCTPILLKGECIGVITLDAFQPSASFTLEDLNLLKAISHQAAVALEKASLYQEKANTVQELEKLNHMIIQQNKLLSRSVEIHNSLAKLVLDGEGSHSIVSYIQQTIGHHTLLFDDLGELVVSAGDSFLSDENLHLLKQTAVHIIELPQMVHSTDEINRSGIACQLVALPIGSKPRLLGVLMVLASKQLGEVDMAALEHACTVISLELVKEQAVFDTEQRLKGELISGLFSEKLNEPLLKKLKHLNFDPTRNYIAIIINLDDIMYKQKHQSDSIIRHLIHIVNRVFLKDHPQGMAVRNHDQIVVLLSFQQKVNISFAAYQIKELSKLFWQEIHNKNWGADVSIGIGRSKAGLAYVHKSLHEATKCLQFIRSYNLENKVLDYADLGAQRFMLQNSEEELVEFIYEVLGPLIEHDYYRKGELLTTLFAYVENNLNAREAAEAMHVHTNTLTYRLKRIEEILSINLADSNQFLHIHLAVKLYPYVKEKISVQTN